jgi:hypothetical protein
MRDDAGQLIVTPSVHSRGQFPVQDRPLAGRQHRDDVRLAAEPGDGAAIPTRCSPSHRRLARSRRNGPKYRSASAAAWAGVCLPCTIGTP